jgi:death-on-curing protein
VKKPQFLTVADVQFLHSISIDRFGGTLGLRDETGLQSAVFHPQNVYFYGGDLFDIAAAYAFHIAEAQSFLDGNKRTAAAAALNFLYANETHPKIRDMDLYHLLIAIAEKRATKNDLADYLRKASQSNT